VKDSKHFPEELLSDTPDAKKNYFQNYYVLHPKLKDATDMLINAIKNSAGFSIIQLIGPTGVGKTTLIKKVIKQIIKESTEEMNKDKSLIPIICVEAISPDSGQFNWKDYFKRCLEALEEPLIDDKIDYDKLVNRVYAGSKFKSNATTPVLRRCFENALVHRKLVALIIDEAQHLAKMASGRRQIDQLDSIKSIANTTCVSQVLVGTYELLPFINMSAQLSRRTFDIHFMRYHSTNEKDMNDYKNIIKQFQWHLPLEKESDLVKEIEFIYERTIGCVGILKNWLERCLAEAVDNDIKTINHKLLEKHAFSKNKISAIALEVVNGEEEFLKVDNEAMNALNKALGLGKSGSDDNSTKKQGTNVKRRVGQRNPIRDKVGMTESGA
jgi:DNA transposition AAA+ family ATPase